MVRRSGLGRGLGALIPPESSTRSESATLQEVPLALIRVNQYQPRKHFDEEALSSLVDSIRAVGVLQPVLLRRASDEEFELIAGERRCRAARRAGLQTIPALVQVVTDAASLERALVENLHREDLNPIDEAAAYQQLIEDFNFTHDEVSRRVGRSRAAVSNALRLFQLPATVQRLVRDGTLSAGHARALLMTPDREVQERLAAEAVANGTSVRALEETVREHVRAVEAAEAEGAAAEAEDARPRPLRSALRPPGVVELEALLADHLSTRVKVDMGGRRGRIVVEFATLDDLERIYRAMLGEASTTG
ncbi:MAG TPA: ParB/RepB/Spo0J family partition protein [Acidimicrobiales bacterium]|nr:ParB/RepB/Spo0J family partition protein [Acidimicrobiales bacterium]